MHITGVSVRTHSKERRGSGMILFRCESLVTDEKDRSSSEASCEPPDWMTARFPTPIFETYLFCEARTARESYDHQENRARSSRLFRLTGTKAE